MIRVILEGLVKRFGTIAAVDGASLELRPGEMTYVVGPAGAGKTTLARLVTGLEPVDDGEIYFGDRMVQSLPAHERKAGLVFPGPRALAGPDGDRERGLSAQDSESRASRTAAEGRGDSDRRYGSTAWPAGGPSSCRPSSGCERPWRGPWCLSPSSWSSTSRWARSILELARISGTT